MRRSERSSSSGMVGRIITKLTTAASVAAVTARAASISPADPTNEGRSSQHSLIPSPSPPTILALAITDSVTIPANPSMALTSTAVTTTTKPDQHVYNSTGYLVEQDEIEYSILAAFSDMQTVFLACISTLLPLIVALAIGFGVRHAWRKYRNRRSSSSGLPWYRGVCSRDDTAESLHHRPHSRSDSIQPTRILSVQDCAKGIREKSLVSGNKPICIQSTSGAKKNRFAHVRNVRCVSLSDIPDRRSFNRTSCTLL